MADYGEHVADTARQMREQRSRAPESEGFLSLGPKGVQLLDVSGLEPGENITDAPTVEQVRKQRAERSRQRRQARRAGRDG